MPERVAVRGAAGVDTPDRGLKLRCPACLHVGVLATTSVNDVGLYLSFGSSSVKYAGIRVCANAECMQLLFVVHQDGTVLLSYPPERIDFDASNLPERVLACIEEAVACHANSCYVAAGMMVRKTLEELCEDRGAEGNNLKARISALGSIVLIPRELLEGMDDLRLLGNDAAHVEAKTYEQIGKEEVEISLEFAKEVLKAVYQYGDLLERLRSLKKVRSEASTQ